MRFLIVGSGGREHALVWKLRSEAEVIATPGNPGIAELCETFLIKADNTGGLAALCQRIQPDVVVIGPEDPLIAGLADHLRLQGQSVLGPGAEAALLEGSKAFAKALMSEFGVPTAAFQSFQNPEEADGYVRSRFDAGKQVAVKASGAALGKGVVVCDSLDEAEEAIERMMLAREFGAAGDTVVIEDRLVGKEFSLIALVSGSHYRCLPPTQDYKRIHDADKGPNTGGMGSVSPVPWLDEATLQRAEEEIIGKMVKGLAAKGTDYRGVLFAGIMVQDGHPFCLEYNVRFGDPETQSLVRRLGPGFANALAATSRGDEIPEFEINPLPAVTVVCASQGYPGPIHKGRPIHLGSFSDQTVLFHSGTALEGERLVTAGGRVIGVSAVGPTAQDARAIAYRGVEQVGFDGMQFRKDIGA